MINITMWKQKIIFVNWKCKEGEAYVRAYSGAYMCERCNRRTYATPFEVAAERSNVSLRV